MPSTSGGSFRFVHNVAAVIQQLKLSLGGDAQKALGDTAALLDDRDRQLEDYLGDIDRRVGSTAGVPSGGMFDWAGGAPPEGFLLCDGTAVSRETYADLFLALGTIWGAGDGSTTFNLPDFRGRATIGAGAGPGLSGRTVGQKGGEERHTLSLAEMPAHDHGYTYWLPSGTPAYQFSASGFQGMQNLNTVTGATGSGSSHNVMQPYAVVTKIIKT
jgi:microcystin-dependent protein